LEFLTRIAPGTPELITTDIQRLQQILKNLLGNAFKFTDRGHVYLDIHSVPEKLAFKAEGLKSAKQILAFTVSDTGIGIANEKQQLIFEAFQQADTTTARKYGGTGLGLTISRELARLLGGEIWLKSTPGKGSHFTFFLPVDNEHPDTLFGQSHPIEPAIQTPSGSSIIPLQVSKNSSPQTEDLTPNPTNLSKKTILIIDDDPRNLFAVTTLLEARGAEVLTAESGREGLMLLQQRNNIDLVLMDIMMPEMDGYTATQEIRRQERFASLPVIALTAKAMPEDRERSIRAGCSDFVPKPVENERLLSTIQRWINRSKMQR
jgi:CheY-like chemotaxis protein